jgi:hypothetical protein
LSVGATGSGPGSRGIKRNFESGEAMKTTLSTKRVLIWFALFSVLGIAIGISIVAAQVKNEHPASCASSVHHHRYSDLRLALVRITERDSCGFRFQNLEQPVSDRVTFAEDFTVAEVGAVNTPDNIQTTALPRAYLREGAEGVIAYCQVCRVVFSFKTESKKR